jgi:hypothetical protein
MNAENASQKKREDNIFADGDAMRAIFFIDAPSN